MDPYSILEVDKTSSQDEIKKAYRRLAKKHHPDKNGGDDARFKEVATAYEVLGNSNSKQRYDEQSKYQDFFKGDDRHNMSEMFDQMFGNAFSGKSQTKGQDLVMDMQVLFDDAYNGCIKQFNINGNDIKMNFKPGLKSGQKFRLKEKGQPHQFNSSLPNGDLIIKVHVLHDGQWIIQDNDIWIEVSMPWFDIILGTKIQVATPDGQIFINVPRNSHPDKTLRIKDRGYPIYGTGQKGALLCKLKASYPDLNEESFEYINKVKNNFKQ